MPFKKVTSGNPIGRPKGSVSTTSKLIREYINAISKLLPYSIGKVKAYEEVEEIEHREIKITFVDTDGVERDKLT